MLEVDPSQRCRRQCVVARERVFAAVGLGVGRASLEPARERLQARAGTAALARRKALDVNAWRA